MKKILLAFMAMTLFACSSEDTVPVDNENPNPVEECDNVFTGNVLLKSQAEVDAFAANGYCKIDGHLTIGDQALAGNFQSDITSIAGLSDLVEIKGLLVINHNPFLTTLNGLNNVKSIVAGIEMNDNKKLVDMKGLESLSRLGTGEFYAQVNISNNAMLVSFEGLENIGELSELFISNNPSLTSFNGFQNLKRLQSLVINGNNSLTSLSHLSGLTTFRPNPDMATDGRFQINNNTALQSMDGFQNITQFEGFIVIQNNGSLANYCQLSNVLNIGVFNSATVIANNLFNPTVEDIIAGNCSQ
jgi:hypothetical protein